MRLPHIYLEGYIYYITIVVYDRLPLFIQSSYIIPLYDSLNYYRYQHNFKLLGYVIMPDHLHLLIWPEGESTVGDVMRDFKTFTAKRLIRQAQVENNQPLLTAFVKAGEASQRSPHKVWQDDYWDKLVSTKRFIRQKLNYMHRNPVKQGLVEEPQDYIHSSYRSYVYGEEWPIVVDKDWG